MLVLALSLKPVEKRQELTASRDHKNRVWTTLLVWVPMLLLALASGTVAVQAQTVTYDLSTTSVMRIKLPVSQAVTVVMSDPVGKVVAADPTIADAQPITDKSLYLVGKTFGTTTVNLYSASGAPVGLLAVEVGADTSDMSRSIRAAVPNSNVKVSTVNGRVRLSGTVTDGESMQKVLDIVAQYGSPAVINTMTLVGGQQVNLEVRILEAQRDAGRELGISWGGSGKGGTATIGSGPGDLTSGAKSFSSFITNVISGASGISLTATINALETKNLVRTLAEPNLTTLSGVNASFLAGGQVPIRVSDGNGNTTLTYKDFGVRLVFTPIVLEGDRIQIHLDSGSQRHRRLDVVGRSRVQHAHAGCDGRTPRRTELCGCGSAAERYQTQPEPVALDRRCAGHWIAVQVVELPEARYRAGGDRHAAAGAAEHARPDHCDTARCNAACERCGILCPRADGSDLQDDQALPLGRGGRRALRIHHRSQPAEWQLTSRVTRALVRNAALAATLAVLLGGCAYDYLQHTDRVSYSAGNAVKANLESETTSPSKKSMYNTSGLGKNGVITPAAPTAPTP